MEDIVDRLKILRKKEKLSQTEFGKRVGVSRDVINNIELRRVPPKDLLLNTVCKEYSVDPEWLFSGEGDIYINTTETFADSLKKAYGLDDLGVSILQSYLQLDERDKKAVEKFIKNIAKGLE